MKKSAFAVLALSASSFIACGAEPPPEPAKPIASATPPPTPTEIASVAPSAPPPYVPAPVRFENPGGMWMPHQMAAHEAKLKELGLAIDPKELTDPTSSTLSAIVNLSGCSASFVSPDGLIITNHHCAIQALQYNSTPASNLLKDGFLAKTREAERTSGPSARVLVTQKVSDVTPRVFDPKIATRMTDQARFKLIEKNQKDIVAECEKGRPGIRCSVANFNEGAMYYLIEQLEIRDVRIAYAPASGIGNYGGEIDNWRWPRHGGDVSIFRAYVGKDGLPADYSKDNVPYKSAHSLKVAEKPLREGDLVMVAGYPGRTYAQRTRAQVEDAMTFGYPRTQKFCEDGLATLAKLTNKDAQIRANPLVRRFGNQLTNVKGQLDGLAGDNVVALKADHEARLQKWIEETPERKAKYGTVLADINKAYEGQKAHRESDLELRVEFLLPKLVSSAYAIVRMAEERAKPDKDRHPDYQDRNLGKLVAAQESLENTYNREVDIAMFDDALARADKVDKKERADVRGILDRLKLVDLKTTTLPSIPTTPTQALFQSSLEQKDTRVELLKKATLADLKKSPDPMIRFALAIRPLLKDADDRDQAFDGRMAVLKPAYFEAQRAFEGHEIAPDANSTLRITYGTVRGYSKNPGEPANKPFTVLSEVVAKNTGKEPFAAPQNLLDAYAQKKFGPYVDDALGEVPVDFLSDLHITGGNSGSAVLNAKGEITGLAFDSTYETLGSDWLFKPKIARCIGVDIRYVMWLLDAVDGADNLLVEMGRVPAFK